MFSVIPEKSNLVSKKTGIFSKIYLTTSILTTIALIVTGVLVYTKFLSIAPLIFIGIATGTIYIAGIILVGTGILNLKGLKNIFLPKASKEQNAFSLNQQLINELYQELVTYIDDIRSLDHTKIVDQEDALRQQNDPQNRKKFIKNFRVLLSKRQFLNEQIYYQTAQEVLKKLDPKNIIENIKDLIPILEPKIVGDIYQITVNKFGLNTKNPQEIYILREEIKTFIIEWSGEHGNGLEKEDILKKLYDLIDPHCAIFPRSYLSESLFSAEDLMETALEEAEPRDQATDIYLKTLSAIVGKNLTKSLPISESLLTSNQADNFAIDFAQNFRKNVPESCIEEQKYNQLAAEVVGKLYKDENSNIKKFMITRDLDDQIFDLLNYKGKVVYICKRAVKELKITDITDDFTREETENQLDITKLRLELIIRGQMKNSLEYYQFQCMLCDAMCTLYPKFAISFEEKYKNQPDRDHELFPKITNPPKIFGEIYGDLKPSKDELAFSIADKIQTRLKLHEKTFDEALKLKDDIEELMAEFLLPNSDLAKDDEFIKSITTALDPHCVIFLCDNLSKPLFLASDLDEVFNCPPPSVLSTKIYLQVLSSIAKKNIAASQDNGLKYPLPINADLLSNERDRGFFAKNFTDNFIKAAADLTLNEQQYDQLVSKIIDRIYHNCGDDVPRFTINYNIQNDVPKNQFDLLDYKTKVVLMCQRAIKELELTNIPNNFTAEQIESQKHKTMLKLQAIIARQNPEAPSTQTDNMAFFMLQDAMHIIYPKYVDPVGDSFYLLFKRTEECPEIKDPPAIFETPALPVTEAKISSNPELSNVTGLSLKNITTGKKASKN